MKTIGTENLLFLNGFSIFTHMQGKITSVIFVSIVIAIYLTWNAMIWSERFLRPVQKGMSRREVQTLIGPPLKIITESTSRMHGIMTDGGRVTPLFILGPMERFQQWKQISILAHSGIVVMP